MDLRLYFTELPANAALTALDKRLDHLAQKQEPLDGGRRLWITYVPQTRNRPFLHAKPFDIFVSPLRFSTSEIEDFRVGIGVVPKRCMICRAADDAADTIVVLFAIAVEIMSRCGALLRIDDKLGRKMFHIDERELDFPVICLDEFPGAVYEVAHETPDGELGLEWFVDARWICAWNERQNQNSNNSKEFSRFASLDYS